MILINGMNEFPGLKVMHSLILVGLMAWKRHWLTKTEEVKEIDDLCYLPLAPFLPFPLWHQNQNRSLMN